MQNDTRMKPSSLAKTMSHPVLLAGIAGGLAELAWVALYARFTDVSGGEVARQIALTVFPQLAQAPFLAALGVAIHFALSLALAAAFAGGVWRPFLTKRAGATFAAATVALAAVWAINFLVVLPWLNPEFVVLMPYGVTLVSKLLFGVAMAGVLNASRQIKPGSATRLELPARKAAR